MDNKNQNEEKTLIKSCSWITTLFWVCVFIFIIIFICFIIGISYDSSSIQQKKYYRLVRDSKINVSRLLGFPGTPYLVAY
jgi:capsule polysaccharide export protein KpsE/RkpR